MISLASASVEGMASRLIKPNALYHMAVRAFLLSPLFSVSLQSDCFLFLAFISSGSDYFLSLFFSGVDTLDLTKRCFHTNTHILLP